MFTVFINISKTHIILEYKVMLQVLLIGNDKDQLGEKIRWSVGFQSINKP